MASLRATVSPAAALAAGLLAALAGTPLETSAQAEGDADEVGVDAPRGGVRAEDVGDLDAPPEPVTGRAIVEYEAGESLPAEWQPQPPAARPAQTAKPRRLPGDFTARPVVLPRGTFQLAFDVTSVFVDTDPLTTYLPNLALGLAPHVELGATVPTRYDQGERAWTSLDPAPYVAVRFVEAEAVELAARAEALIPASSDARPYAALELPLLWRPAHRVRVDGGIGVELAFDDQVEALLRMPLGLSFQALEWLFAGALATVDVGLTDGRRGGLDGEVFLGLTVQARGVAYFDVLARLFVVNLGGGGPDAASDGGGFGLSVRFYPRAY